MSACWVRVGIPVDGPVRCTSTITAGIPVGQTGSSFIKEIPGPDVDVKARGAFHPAPRTMPIEAIFVLGLNYQIVVLASCRERRGRHSPPSHDGTGRTVE